MRLPRQNNGRGSIEIAMTPMIDVVFLLLVFFVCTASFQAPEDVLPSSILAAGTTPSDLKLEPEPNLERVVVKLRSPAGRLAWIVNDRPYDNLRAVRDGLKAVAEIDPGLPVILDVDGAVPLGDVIDVYDISRVVGFDKIQFAAKKLKIEN
jgi:biopolymer transport protein ExbD